MTRFLKDLGYSLERMENHKMNLSSFVKRSLTTASVVLMFAALQGCSKQQKGDDLVSPDSISADQNNLGDSDSGKAMGLNTVYFDYDSFLLTGTSKKVLEQNASILKSNDSVKIQIEGHCDQRGGIEYNIALGEKRANAVKKFLNDMGINSDRVATISYGKERPIDSAENEAAYSKNRRANFAITEK